MLCGWALHAVLPLQSPKTHWSTDNIALNDNSYASTATSTDSKVIAIGGTAGLVNLWRGILFCDVIKVIEGNKPVPQLRWVALPPWSLQPTGDVLKVVQGHKPGTLLSSETKRAAW
jgi:hypothetical protein